MFDKIQMILMMKTTVSNNCMSRLNYDKILKVTQSLDPNKADGHGGNSARMFKLSCPSTIKPFLIILRNCSKFGTFPDDWKNGNVVSVHLRKKINKLPITTTLYPCYLYAPNFLKSSFLILFLNIR